jgi:hypothetical protein
MAESCHGWFHTYNFGSRAAADYIASDQHEDLANVLKQAVMRDQCRIK